MITVRLARVGTNKTPLYRVVVTDSRAKRDGRHLENIGTYDPRAREGVKGFKIDHVRLAHWRGVGAQLSEEVAHLIERNPAEKAS
jgi:small subunit ribosomal protein S16